MKKAKNKNVPLEDRARVAYRATGSDGMRYVVRSDSSATADFLGVEGMGELAAYWLSEATGFHRVPRTGSFLGRDGKLWTAQEYVPGNSSSPHPRRSAEWYRLVQTQQAAALDYVLCSEDRHLNYRLSRDGDLALYDNHIVLKPYKPRMLDVPLINSEFTFMHLNQPLDEEVLAGVRRVEPRVWRETLLAMGIEPAAAGQSVQRLEEIQRCGRITGESLPIGERIGGQQMDRRAKIAWRDATGE